MVFIFSSQPIESTSFHFLLIIHDARWCTITFTCV